MIAAKIDIYVEQGTDFVNTVEIKDESGALVDLTGCTGEGQIRSRYDNITILATITVTLGSLGQLLISMANAVTSGIPVDASKVDSAKKVITKYPYDVEMTDSLGKKHRILDGIASVSPEVTR